MTKPKAVIKKYGNRRLYDSTGSRYVNLEEIARMLRDGIEVEVRDARTGKDLTRVILTEIIVDQAREQEKGLPLQLLRQLVVASDRATHEFLSWYLDTALELYQKAASEARLAVASPVEFVRHLLNRPSEGGEIERLRRRVEELEGRLAEQPRPGGRGNAKRGGGGRTT